MLKEFDISITVTEIIIYLPGLILLGIWLFRTSLGRDALADSVPRRNNMPALTPFILLFIWFGSVPLALSITRKLLPDLPDWQNALVDNSLICISAVAAIAVIVFLARVSFARRLKGFGLNPKTIHKDLLAALLNLLAVSPLVMLMLMLTIFLGQLIRGPDFQIRQHEELQLLLSHRQLSLRVLIIVTTVAIVPVFEEMLFRGLFQTMLRSFLDARYPMLDARKGVWLAILISSAMFAMVHYEPTHWPALFVLAICLGYSYEKSGSLFRPIFIHSLFNAASVITALYSV